MGHGAFIPKLTVDTVFRKVLDLRPREADALARKLVRHQALATDRIMSISRALLRETSQRAALRHPRRTRLSSLSSPSALSVSPVNRTAAGIG